MLQLKRPCDKCINQKGEKYKNSHTFEWNCIKGEDMKKKIYCSYYKRK